MDFAPKSNETETERLLAMAQKHGAKMFKKGDLEIHFETGTGVSTDPKTMYIYIVRNQSTCPARLTLT